MHFGLGQSTITQQGKLQLEISHEVSGFITSGEPVGWGAIDDGVKAILSQYREVIEAWSESVCGTSVIDADRIVSVPGPVFEAVDGIEPGAEVGFAADREMMEHGVMYMVAMERFFDEFQEINPPTSGKRF